MSITSFSFVFFVIVSLVFYYIIPKKFQWCILLAASIVFYAMSGWTNVIYILLASAVAYLSAVWMQKKTDYQKAYLSEHKSELSKEEKREFKAKIKSIRKRIMILSVLFFTVILVALKILSPSSFLSGVFIDSVNIIVPLGISYYTLQTIGYIVDVYWNITNAETNYLKLLLFTSFFPQMTQGPINDYRYLSSQFYTEHHLSYDDFTKGFERAMWGYFKKIVIADTMALYINDLFANYSSYSSPTLLIGVASCMIRLYVDFSGYMDIVCGICKMFGIDLTENFNRPFSSRSLSEFWTKWHISLGAWFKKYVFFPVAVSGWNKRISDRISKHLGEQIADKYMSSMALFSVWLLIGFWHGASAAYIIWGLINGIIMIASDWLDPVYSNLKAKCRINDKSKIWKAIQVARTFVIVSFLEVLTDVGGLHNGVIYICRSVSFIKPKSVYDLLPYYDIDHLTSIKAFILAIVEYMDDAHNAIICVFSLICVLAVSILGRNRRFGERFSKLPLFVRVVIMSAMFVVVVIFGAEASVNNVGGFLYAEF